MLDWRLWTLLCEEYSPGVNVVGVEDLQPQGPLKLARCLLGHLCMAYSSGNELCPLLCTFPKCKRLCADAALLKVEEVWLNLFLR